MRHYHGLETLLEQLPGRPTTARLAEALLADLQTCRCTIYGCIGDDDRIVLAELTLVTDSLAYDSFDRRIDLSVAGPILRADCVPLTFRLVGRHFAITGRCSALPHVCGRDLYLSAYSGRIGDMVRQRFAIPLKSLMN